MNDVTRLITCEITYIQKDIEAGTVKPMTEERMREFAKAIKRAVNADDVHVVDVQSFIGKEKDHAEA